MAETIKPSNMKPRSWLVRLWTIPRGAPRGEKPVQRKSFYVKAPTIDAAQKAARHELVAVQHRAVRSLGWQADQTISAVVFDGETVAEPPTSPELRRNAVAQAHARRKAGARQATLRASAERAKLRETRRTQRLAARQG